MKALSSINPYTSALINNYQQDSPEEIKNKINELQDSFLTFKSTSYTFRSQLLIEVQDYLLKNKNHYARLITTEMGKPISQSIAEVEKCAWVCQYYAENGPKLLQDKTIKTDASKSFVSYQPLGILLAIMPWNFPFWQFFRVLAPNILLGNVVLLKHASNVSACALAIEDIFKHINFPNRLSRTILSSGSKMQEVIEHPLIKAVSLTGSENAGRAVAKTAGQALKKCVLELGGNNAVIVMEDADIDKHIQEMAWARYLNTGQSCIAGKRFLVHEAIFDKFLSKFTNVVKQYNVGNPLDENTDIGPLVNEQAAIDLNKQIQQSLVNGNSIHIGGKFEKAHFQPTILMLEDTNVPVFIEETFGPVAAITKIKSFDEAISMSNHSTFGLGVSIFTENEVYQEQAINVFDEGAVFINSLVKSDPRLPFGGIKNSGFGRELSEEGLKEFANIKTIYVR